MRVFNGARRHREWGSVEVTRDLQLAYLMLQYLHSTGRSSLVIIPQVILLPHNSISICH